MRSESLEFLKRLLTTPSPSGFETRGQSVWLGFCKSLADEVRVDRHGNAYACLNPGGSPRVMLTGHSDEIGLIVSHITESGFLYMMQLGGLDPSVMRGKRINVHNHRGLVRGVIGATAIHLQDREKSQKAPKQYEIFADIGAASREEAAERVAIGDPITFTDDFEMLTDDIAVARAFDNRVGTWSVAETLRLLAENKDQLKAEVWAVATIQEEIGGHGAQMASYSLEPDICLAVDVTHATDSPGLSKERYGEILMGKGPTLAYGSANHPVLVERLKTIATRDDIPLQFEVTGRYTGTDLDSIYVQRGGIVGAIISLPNRYMHTTVEMIHLRDLEQVAQLMTAFCLDLDEGEEIKVVVDY